MTERLNELLAKLPQVEIEQNFGDGPVMTGPWVSVFDLSSALAGIARPAQEKELHIAWSAGHAQGFNVAKGYSSESPDAAWKRFLAGRNAVVELAEAARPTRDGGTGWRSIDSAPKDGTLILASDGNNHVIVGWEAGYSDKSIQRWENSGGFECHVTHWMPLPDPPSSGGTDA